MAILPGSYKIVSAARLEDMEQEVNRMIEQQYGMVGGVSLSAADGRFYQAMAKYVTKTASPEEYERQITARASAKKEAVDAVRKKLAEETNATFSRLFEKSHFVALDDLAEQLHITAAGARQRAKYAGLLVTKGVVYAPGMRSEKNKKTIVQPTKRLRPSDYLRMAYEEQNKEEGQK